MIKKYVKKPISIVAVQFTGMNESEVSEFAVNKIWVNELVKWSKLGETYNPEKHIKYFIETPEGNMSFTKGDYIIKDENGIFRPIPKDIFEETYEEASNIGFAAEQDMIQEIAEQARRGLK